MKKITCLFVLVTFVFSCGVKQTQSMLSDGDYDGAIHRAAEGLKTNKNAKGKQDYVYLMEEAFAKAKERDLRNIDMLSKDTNPANFEKVYNTYLQLNNRQEKIRPLLPLKLLKQGRDAYFPFDDYSAQIVNSKNALSKYLYDNSKLLLKTNDKMSYRRAYDDFAYLESINPGYKDVKQLMDEAQFKGTDFVNVFTKNETNMIIPARLQSDLLDFSTFGLNDKWTVYHSNRQKGINYDYGMIVNFRQINISPEQIKEKEFIKEKQIKDGTKTLVDANGNVVKDSLGNPIKVDNFKTIRANIYEFRQFKACQVTAKVDYVDFRTNQLIETFPLTSEFNFEYIYANYNGDKRACDDNYLMYFDRRAVPFPSNEQMVFDTGEDLKAKLKSIITRNKFRR
ncbi:hypothetical protein FSS13T_14190 [Flavobacterium saliperosum S13]|uniref:Lipoprotein n=2 Tax=Flavobacterium saliperosum TaxID=329186 RepID=A0A1G4VGD6_9FLAO|nr:hypothetical protein [Flavobacterium saliperosum]ESU25787.1 hypothetical protein FSS13T_14190 [Flavobacterium saliperosum S13]SCX05596.1 hypothetical protein SAMN02927925_00852 [Flavobacterium saliperosum]